MRKRALLLEAGLSASSRARYAVIQSRYRAFCLSIGVSAFPASQYSLEWYLVHRAGQLAPAGLSQELAAINSFHVDSGWAPVVVTATLRRLLKGAAAFRAPSSLQRDPITPDILLKLLDTCDLDSVDGSMLACAFVFAFFGLLRPGEISSRTPGSPSQWTPRLGDVVCRSEGISLRLRSSKTSQHRPVWVHIGATGGFSCPLALLTLMLKVRRGAGLPMSPSDFLFMRRSGRPLSRSFFAEPLSLVGSEASPPLHLTPHSFRIGGASALHLARLPAHVIQAAGRWRSDVFKSYCRSSPSFLFQLTRSMLGSHL